MKTRHWFVAYTLIDTKYSRFPKNAVLDQHPMEWLAYITSIPLEQQTRTYEITFFAEITGVSQPAIDDLMARFPA